MSRPDLKAVNELFTDAFGAPLLNESDMTIEQVVNQPVEPRFIELANGDPFECQECGCCDLEYYPRRSDTIYEPGSSEGYSCRNCYGWTPMPDEATRRGI